MSARAETLAKQFEAKAAEMTSTLEKLTDADWKKTTGGEKWTVGVAAHHVAGAHEPITGILKTVASGKPMPPFTMAMLDEGNAKHAVEFANCTKDETLALHKKGAAAAAAAVRGLSDAELDRSGSPLTGMPAMTAQQIIEGILIHHIDDHLGSIRKTVGRLRPGAAPAGARRGRSAACQWPRASRRALEFAAPLATTHGEATCPGALRYSRRRPAGRPLARASRP